MLVRVECEKNNMVTDKKGESCNFSFICASNEYIIKKRKIMLATTTPTIEGKRITKYYGIVTGETIIGANLFRDFLLVFVTL